MADVQPRRAGPRHACTSPVRLVVEGGAGATHQGYLRDLGPGGAFIHVLDGPAVGTLLRLWFHAPLQGSAVEARAIVVRTQGPVPGGRPEEVGLAVRFLEPGTGTPTGPVLPVERRATPRRRCALALSVHASAPRAFTGFARDLSTAGLFVHAFALPSIGDELALRLAPGPGEPGHEAIAAVVWLRPEVPGCRLDEVGFGARFVHASPGLREALARHVAADHGQTGPAGPPDR